MESYDAFDEYNKYINCTPIPLVRYPETVVYFNRKYIKSGALMHDPKRLENVANFFKGEKMFSQVEADDIDSHYIVCRQDKE